MVYNMAGGLFQYNLSFQFFIKVFVSLTQNMYFQNNEVRLENLDF